MTASVRTHTRRTRSGRTTTVHHHSRATRPRSWHEMQHGRRYRRGTGRRLRPRRAGRNLWRALAAVRRHKGKAALFATAGLLEFGTWATVRGTTGALVGLGFALTVLVVPPIWLSVHNARKG